MKNKDRCSFCKGKDEGAILKHGCFHKLAGIGVDESLIWGDYYFMEALVKAISLREV